MLQLPTISGRAYRYSRPIRLEAIGLSASAAMETCKSNTRAELGPLPPIALSLPANHLGTLDQSYYESSRLLFPEDWSGVAMRMGGELLVTAPAVDLVLYANGAEPSAIGALAALTLEMAARAERPLSPTVFRWTPEGWEEEWH